MQNSLRLYRFQRVIVILAETKRHVILRIHGSRLLKRACRCTFLHCFRDVEPLRTKLASSALRFSSLQTLSPRKGTKLTKMRKKKCIYTYTKTKIREKKHTTHPAPASPAEHEPTGGNH